MFRHCALLTILATPAVFGQSLEFEILPVGPGSTANDLNNRGQVVGVVGLEGFLLEDGVMTGINVRDAFGTQPSAINESGEIVGFYALADPSMGAPSFGFHRSPEGEYTTIEFEGAHSTVLLGLNNRGDTVGNFVMPPPAPPFPSAFLLEGDGTFTILDIPGALASSASGINDQGTITGIYLDPAFVGHGFVLEDGVASVVDFPDAAVSDVTRINNREELIGNFSASNPQTFDSGWVLSRRGQGLAPRVLFDEVTFPRAALTVLRGLNDHGDLSGSVVMDAGSPPQAFIAIRP